MRALSIRQPYVEQILRGLKTVEYRSRPTRIIGERFYIYAARTPGPASEWAALGLTPGTLPTGRLLATAEIEECVPNNGRYEWRLANVRPLKRPRPVKRHPQPGWFWPW